MYETTRDLPFARAQLAPRRQVMPPPRAALEGVATFIYVEHGAARLIEAALARVAAGQVTLQFEGESTAVGIRNALRRLALDERWTRGILAVTRAETSTQRQAHRACLARVMLARSAGGGSLTFVASESSSAELRQQLFALTQVLTEEFPRANVRINFAPQVSPAQRHPGRAARRRWT